jgi:hypothetical protein
MVESYHRKWVPSVRAAVNFVTNMQSTATPLAEPVRAGTSARWTTPFVCYRRRRPLVRGKERRARAGQLGCDSLVRTVCRRDRLVAAARIHLRGTAWQAVAAYQPSRFSISYYLTAMMFIVFDIEMVFLAPLAVLMKRLALFGFVELVLFVVLLGVGYVYIWRKGALEWK